jgi:hypothetical protein
MDGVFLARTGFAASSQNDASIPKTATVPTNSRSYFTPNGSTSALSL